MSVARTRLTMSCVLLASVALAQSTVTATKTVRPLRAAFVVSEGFNLIDLAGPWEVFNTARLPQDKDHPYGIPLFENYTVSASTSPVRTGLSETKLVPDYIFANAPEPDIIVVGAQDWRNEVPGLADWLKKQSASHVIVMSVCIGASQLADAGLLDGKQATTHHAFLKDFRDGYPKTKWLEGKRFVKVSDTVWTAGGLTSGIDLALHIVALRFGEPTAESAANYLEYTGTGWKQSE